MRKSTYGICLPLITYFLRTVLVLCGCEKLTYLIIMLFCFVLVFSFSVFHAFQYNWAPSSEFVSSSIPSWQILTAHAQPFRGARDLVFCLKVPLDSLLVWASSGGSGETAQMRRLAWTFAARICDKYQIPLTRSNYVLYLNTLFFSDLYSLFLFTLLVKCLFRAKFTLL